MRPIDADAFECVCTTLPDEVDSDSYLAGMFAGMDEILKRIDDAPTIQPFRVMRAACMGLAAIPVGAYRGSLSLIIIR